MRISGYSTYKPSGIEWLGNIPNDWDVKRLRHVLTRNDGGVWGDEDDPEGTVVLRSTEQTLDGGWKIDDPARRTLSASEKRECRLDVGDLIVTKSSGSALHIGKTSLVTTEIAALAPCFSNFMQRLRLSIAVDPRLGFYLLNCPTGRQQLVFNSNTTTGLANLNGSVLGDVFFGLPPSLDEQQAIANFLDRETAKLDTLVEKKQALIEKLKEKRAVLISYAVTRGLPPNAARAAGLDPHPKLKPSGIDWLGDVPQHWEIAQLRRFILFITSGSRGWAEHYADEGAIFVRIGNLTRDSIKIDLSDIQRVDPPAGSEGERTRIAVGDVLFSITAYLGSVAVADESIAGAYINQHIALVRLAGTGVAPRFTAYSVLGGAGQAQLSGQGYGGTKIQLALDDVKALWLPIPPPREQDVIVDYLDSELAKIDRMVDKVEEAIARLQEYRTALITAAVTGKIDVRGQTTDNVTVSTAMSPSSHGRASPQHQA